jgi:hypothetical protein
MTLLQWYADGSVLLISALTLLLMLMLPDPAVSVLLLAAAARRMQQMMAWPVTTWSCCWRTATVRASWQQTACTGEQQQREAAIAAQAAVQLVSSLSCEQCADYRLQYVYWQPLCSSGNCFAATPAMLCLAEQPMEINASYSLCVFLWSVSAIPQSCSCTALPCTALLLLPAACLAS